MRIQSWLVLAAVMVGGTAFAFLVGLVWFPLNPVAVSKEVPQSRILVAKKDIPAGTVLYADSVQYDFVPNDRIPVGATSDFFQVYARKTLNPIIKGSPICDLDMGGTFSGSYENNESIPSGLSLVRILINRVQGIPISGVLPCIGMTFSVDSLAGSLKSNDLVDLMVLETSQKLASAETAASGKKSSDGSGGVFIRKPPKLLASGIRVYSSVEVPQKTNSTPAEYPSLTLLMSQEQISLAKTASKEGRLQVCPHPIEEKSIPKIANLCPVWDQPTMEKQATNTTNTTEAAEAVEASVAPKFSSPYQAGEILPVTRIIAASHSEDEENAIEQFIEPPQQPVATDRQAEGRKSRTQEPAPLEKPRPKVIEIGLGSYKKTAANKTRQTSGKSSNTVESSTWKSSGETPLVEIYSFAPKNKKKTDLFPKYFYNIPEQEIDRGA